jgi:phage shock protein PspC (stress-responsive transcriptional regulator)
MTTPDLPAPLSRLRRGRVLGGVCAGLAARWSVPVAGVRAGFALATPVFGLGALVYLAAWLVLPVEGEDGATGPRGVVLLAQVAGSLVALATLAVAGAVATVFGLGWVVVALGAALLVGVLVGWPRFGPAWALLPVAALTLPAMALAAGGLRLEPQTQTQVLAPHTVRALPPRLRSGLGLIEVDLRHTAWPRRGTVSLRVEAGLGRTLIALPHDRCVHVQVRQDRLPPASRVAATLLGAGALSVPGVRLFGDLEESEAAVRSPGRRPGPTLRVRFASAGGELVVRDYPDRVDPTFVPEWPGYPVAGDVRPDTTGLTRAQARRIVARWRKQRTAQRHEVRRITRLQRGPCARPAATHGAARHGTRSAKRRTR